MAIDDQSRDQIIARQLGPQAVVVPIHPAEAAVTEMGGMRGARARCVGDLLTVGCGMANADGDAFVG